MSTDQTQKPDRKAYFAEYEKKRNRVQVSFSPSEYAEIEALAKSLDLPLATFVRNLALATSKRVVLTSPAIEEELKGLSFLIRSISNNLNQIARHSNRVKNVVDENQVFDHLRQLELALQETVKRQQQ